MEDIYPEMAIDWRKSKGRILGNAVIYETEGVTENKQPLERPGENPDLQCSEARGMETGERALKWMATGDSEKNNGTEWQGSRVTKGESVVRK